MSRAALYYHTIRHLRPIQVATRLWYAVHRARADLRAPARPRIPTALYVAPRNPEPSLLGPDTFRFLNVERRCATACDWQPAEAAPLWAYNLHYFDDLNARDSPQRATWHRNLLQRWVTENPPGSSVGWDAYPLSRRLVNWIKWALQGNSLPPGCEASMAVQARWLTHHLEYQILGNHLLANAQALIHVGLYFEGAESQRWYERGLGLLNRQLSAQVLSDGGHFELSTMYHAIVLEDLLDLVNVVRSYGREPPPAWLEVVARMRRWYLCMTQPDGDLAFFNDATFDVAAQATSLDAYAGRLGLARVASPPEALTVLAASGYVRACAGPAWLLCDCAAVGASYQPGHAHADTLSFELSLGRQRVIVNSGVSEYGRGPERQRQRGTAAHNAVVLNGMDSSEVWAGFRVARRARATLHSAALEGPAVRVEASHDGYRRLPGANIHRRVFRLDAAELQIVDEISGSYTNAEAWFHLHPRLRPRTDGPDTVVLTCDEVELATCQFQAAAAVEVVPDTWQPAFGVRQPSTCIRVRLQGGRLVSTVRWGAAA